MKSNEWYIKTRLYVYSFIKSVNTAIQCLGLEFWHALKKYLTFLGYSVNKAAYSKYLQELKYFSTRDNILKQIEKKYGFYIARMDSPTIGFTSANAVQRIVLQSTEHCLVKSIEIHFEHEAQHDIFVSARIKRIGLTDNKFKSKDILLFIKSILRIIANNTYKYLLFKNRKSINYTLVDYQISKIILLFVFLNKETARVFNSAVNRVIDLELGDFRFNWPGCFETYFASFYNGKYELRYSILQPNEGKPREENFSHCDRILIDDFSMTEANLYEAVEHRIMHIESY